MEKHLKWNFSTYFELSSWICDVMQSNPHDYLLSLSFAGFDVVTLANNHLNDFGSEGVNFTVDVLKKTGVKYFGVSYGKYDASQVSMIVWVSYRLREGRHSERNRSIARQ